MKKTLKYALIALLFISIVAVPLLGVSFNDVGYNKETDEKVSNWTVMVPSVCEENAILADISFGGGSSIYLEYDSEDEKINSKDSLEKGAKALEERFQSRGFNDAKGSVEDGKIRLDISQKTHLNSVMADFGAIGDWFFTGSDMQTVLCDSSYVKDAYAVVAGQNQETGKIVYSITVEFTEKGAEEFYANTASYAISSSNFFLMLDGQLVDFCSLSDSTVKDTFTFGQHENYEDAAAIASFIKSGPLPAGVKVVEVKELGSSMGTVAVILAVLFLVASAVAFYIYGKKAGVFAILATVSNAAILLISLLTASYQLNLTTFLTMLIVMILSTVHTVFALRPIGTSLAEKGSITSAAFEKLSKFNVKSLWIHFVILMISLVCMMFVQGSFAFVVRITTVFSIANVATYFTFVVFGIHTMADSKK